MTRYDTANRYWEWFIILTITLTLLLILTCPARADSILPDITDAEHYTMMLYGGASGQEAWCSFYTPLDQDRAGSILGALGEIPGLEPLALYGWYRFRGDLDGSDPEEAQDHSFGTLYAIDSTGDDWQPYFAAEQVTLTSGPRLDRAYYGLGAKWRAREGLALDGSVWHDGTDGYRIAGTVEATVRVSTKIELMVWCIIDADDPWGFWRLTATHPMGDYDAVVVYEDSTRSESTYLIGIGMPF